MHWVWTPAFFLSSLSLILLLLILSLHNWAEVSSYGEYTLREHWWAVFIAGWFVVVSHEFAHGLTCKAFGGRASEVGLLMVYYFLPALYCNVSGIHLIPKRGNRLWVIAAGVYWQILVGVFALLIWFIVAPHSLLSDVTFIFFLGSILDVVFNANPLIKLDGYYFLSQALGLPNLMERSRGYWKGVWRKLVYKEEDKTVAQYSQREQRVYAIFGLLSFFYSVLFTWLIIFYVSNYLMDSYYLLGVLLSIGVMFIFLKPSIQSLILPVISWSNKMLNKTNNETNKDTKNGSEITSNTRLAKLHSYRPYLVKATILLFLISLLMLPWQASVGSYGTLIAIAEKEAIIRIPENATLIELEMLPGDSVKEGMVIGRLGNNELQEEILQARSELVRANTDYRRLLGEQQTHGEAINQAKTQLNQRKYDFNEIDIEQKQINQAPTLVEIARVTSSKPKYNYPADIAVLESDLDLRHTRVQAAKSQFNRAQLLFNSGLISQNDLEVAQTQVTTLELESKSASERLQSALVNHSRKYENLKTNLDLADSNLNQGQLEVKKLDGEIEGLNTFISSLMKRIELLENKQLKFELVAPKTGVIFGEELPKQIGQYFKKGTELCRIADTSKMLVRIQVPERDIGDVKVGYNVRLKALSFSDRVFYGKVTKIGGESEQNQYNQPSYRVELIIENSDGLLRPGMTAFARIDFGQQPIGQILIHKLKQTLRPELWLF